MNESEEKCRGTTDELNCGIVGKSTYDENGEVPIHGVTSSALRPKCLDLFCCAGGAGMGWGIIWLALMWLGLILKCNQNTHLNLYKPMQLSM